MANEFSFQEFEKNTSTKDIAPNELPKSKKKEINFQEMPKDTEDVLGNEKRAMINKYTKEEAIPMPMEGNMQNSYLNLVLSPNLRELEMMIRGLEYVKRFNPITGKEEILLRKIEGHPLNEYGINRIMSELKVYCSPEIKLGRKKLLEMVIAQKKKLGNISKRNTLIL